MMVQSPNITPALLDPNGRVVQDVYRNGPISGSGTVTTSGTPVQLKNSSQEAKVIDIYNPNLSSGDVIIIGGSTVSYSSTIGIPIQPGFTYRLQVKDLSQIWVDAQNNGDKFTYNYFY